jgi:hypothetical protein
MHYGWLLEHKVAELIPNNHRGGLGDPDFDHEVKKMIARLASSSA